MRVSIVVPVRDNARELEECLNALRAGLVGDAEIVVVDDASHDDSAAAATRAGVRVVRLVQNVGPAAARNAGVRRALGDVLVFVDSDVVVSRDTVARLAGVLAARPDVAAVFGSYDAEPRAPGIVSQYRNLLHHFVHQHGNPDASTFWAGCGAMRRSVFDAVGGFDESARLRAIEDVELGYRLRAAGHRIVLDRGIQVTHLKRWTVGSVVWTDAMLRALPWSRLVVQRRPPADLNISGSQRLSVALTCLSFLLLAGALRWPTLPLASIGGMLAVLVVNRRLLTFFARVRGRVFALATIPLLLLYYLESGACYAWARLERVGGTDASDRATQPSGGSSRRRAS